jgi:hypothetical protein
LEASYGGDQKQCEVLMGDVRLSTSFLISERRFTFFLTFFFTNSSPIQKIWGSFSSPDAGE